MNLTIIVSVAVSALGVIVSCLLSYITARKEVNKLKLSLAHADKETVCKTFEELQQAVRLFLLQPIGIYRNRAVQAVGKYITYADEKSITLCKSLCTAMNNNDTHTSEDILDRLTSHWNENKPYTIKKKSLFRQK